MAETISATPVQDGTTVPQPAPTPQADTGNVKSIASSSVVESVASSSLPSSSLPAKERAISGVSQLTPHSLRKDVYSNIVNPKMKELCDPKSAVKVMKCDDCDEKFLPGFDMAEHQYLHHEESYKLFWPKCRGRIPKRKRYPRLFLSQVRKIHPDPDGGTPGDPMTDPSFFLPGTAVLKKATGCDLRDPQTHVRGDKFVCPVRGCCKAYKREFGLVYHCAQSICEPHPDVADTLDAKFAEHDEAAHGSMDGWYHPDEPTVLKDVPFLTQYKWPQEEWGISCIAHPHLESFTGIKGFQHQHAELDFRWASLIEKRFLRRNNLIAEEDLGQEIIVCKAEEILRLLATKFPKTHHEKLKQCRNLTTQATNQPGASSSQATLSAINFDFTIEAAFTVGSRELAKSMSDAAARQAVRYNAALSYERHDERSTFYDHNTQITHFPYGKMLREVKNPTRYPVARIPTQYHSYKRFKSLRDAKDYLNPPSEEDRSQVAEEDKTKKINAQKERVMEKIRARHQGQPDRKTMKKVKASALCGFCLKTQNSNKKNKFEEMVGCATCPNAAHPSCLGFDDALTDMIRTYEWQCIDCKGCSVCRDAGDEEKMLFCDCCDRGYHTYCIGLSGAPKGRWVCKLCGLCASCGTTTPGPDKNDKWQHKYDSREEDQPKFLQTLCVSCSKVFDKGDFCPSCLVVYRTDETDLPMVCCDKCDRWVHAECDNIDEDKYEDLSQEGSYYECLLCRGEQPERFNIFHRNHRTKEIIEIMES
eukprot:m.142274 g.142274  ORF g.142274 m.142274 type:complete len:759 (-) comp30243_c0_seq1:347-2623(-)